MLSFPGPRAQRAEPGIYNHRPCNSDTAIHHTTCGCGFRARWQVGNADLPAPRNDGEGNLRRGTTRKVTSRRSIDPPLCAGPAVPTESPRVLPHWSGAPVSHGSRVRSRVRLPRAPDRARRRSPTMEGASARARRELQRVALGAIPISHFEACLDGISSEQKMIVEDRSRGERLLRVPPAASSRCLR